MTDGKCAVMEFRVVMMLEISGSEAASPLTVVVSVHGCGQSGCRSALMITLCPVQRRVGTGLRKCPVVAPLGRLSGSAHPSASRRVNRQFSGISAQQGFWVGFRELWLVDNFEQINLAVEEHLDGRAYP